MDRRASLLGTIQERVAYLESRISNAGKLNYTSLHSHAENFYRDLFNLLGDTYENANAERQNSPYIDLIDKTNKKVMQITAQNDGQKIKKTLDGICNNPAYQGYSIKLLLICKPVKAYKINFESYRKSHNFDPEQDIIDIPKLLRIVSTQKTDVLEKIDEFLDKELDMPNKKSLTKEVGTIMGLLIYLSDDKNYKASDVIYECDPEKKVNGRFKAFADKFTSEFSRLYPIYHSIFLACRCQFDLDTIRAVKINNFLTQISNKFLEDCHNNPTEALDRLTAHFESILTQDTTDAIDNGAIRYFLLEELLGCSLFSTPI